jgi:hypothetical protein
MLFIFNLKGLQEVSITNKCKIKVKCIAKPNKKAKITIGKKYVINETSILNSTGIRIKCDSGRNVWYRKKFFQEVK